MDFDFDFILELSFINVLHCVFARLTWTYHLFLFYGGSQIFFMVGIMSLQSGFDSIWSNEIFLYCKITILSYFLVDLVMLKTKHFLLFNSFQPIVLSAVDLSTFSQIFNFIFLENFKPGNTARPEYCRLFNFRLYISSCSKSMKKYIWQ